MELFLFSRKWHQKRWKADKALERRETGGNVIALFTKREKASTSSHTRPPSSAKQSRDLVGHPKFPHFSFYTILHFTKKWHPGHFPLVSPASRPLLQSTSVVFTIGRFQLVRKFHDSSIRRNKRRKISMWRKRRKITKRRKMWRSKFFLEKLRKWLKNHRMVKMAEKY